MLDVKFVEETSRATTASPEIIIFDTEYWTERDAPARSWAAYKDRSKYLYQVHAQKLRLSDYGLEYLDRFSSLVIPEDEFGKPVFPTTFFYELTGITKKDILERAKPIKEVVPKFFSFCKDCTISSYGNDVIETILPSCYKAGIPVEILPSQFLDFREILRMSSIPIYRIDQYSSGSLFNLFGLQAPLGNAHDANFDVASLCKSLEFLCYRNSSPKKALSKLQLRLLQKRNR